jgi:hypothetical protein
MSPVLNRSPPKTPVVPGKGYGRYCIKAKSRVLTKCGNTYINITGYDTEPSISDRVERVAEYKGKSHKLAHTEVEVVFITDTALLADGTIFLDYVECNSTLTIPPWNFRGT